MTKAIQLFAPLLLSAATLGTAYAADIDGAKDNPILGRFAGSEITGYQESDFDEVGLPNGPIKSRDDKLMTIDGRVTRIGYKVAGNKSLFEIAHNFGQALKAKGFQQVYACGGDDCGGQFSSVVINSGKVMPSGYSSTFNDQKQRAYLGKQSGPNGDTWVFIYLMDDTTSNHANYIYQEIVEPKAMATDQIKVIDARGLKDALDSTGKVALYGLYFDTDKAEIKPESQPELAEMGKLLTANPAMKVYIVGHTDNQGAFAHNLDLAQHRADAVTKALETTYQIPAERLSAKSVASLAPVASNADETGRAKNRRVEMVVQ